MTENPALSRLSGWKAQPWFAVDAVSLARPPEILGRGRLAPDPSLKRIGHVASAPSPRAPLDREP